MQINRVGCATCVTKHISCIFVMGLFTNTVRGKSHALAPISRLHSGRRRKMPARPLQGEILLTQLLSASRLLTLLSRMGSILLQLRRVSLNTFLNPQGLHVPVISPVFYAAQWHIPRWLLTGWLSSTGVAKFCVRRGELERGTISHRVLRSASQNSPRQPYIPNRKL